MKVSEDKSVKEEKLPGLRDRAGLRALKDSNDNNIEVRLGDKKEVTKKGGSKTEPQGAEAVVDLKAEAAKRRQSKFATR